MTFTVTTYNVLATAYAYPERYPHTQPEWLDPALRTPALVEQIAALGSDILCLQEVEADTYEALRLRLAPIGYDGEWTPKGRHKPDGCAIFYRTAAIRRVDFTALLYDDAFEDQPQSGHVAQILVAEASGLRIAIANTHLKWDTKPNAPVASPKRRYGLREIRSLIERLHATAAETDGAILCGDLNAPPDDAIIETLLDAGFAVTHPLRPATPTAVVNGRIRQLDYIFHRWTVGQPPHIDPVPLTPIDRDTPMPGPDHPSDHLPLAAAFTLTPA